MRTPGSGSTVVAGALLISLGLVAACHDGTPRIVAEAIDPPTGDSVVGLQLGHAGGDGVLASWLAPGASRGYALRFAQWTGLQWSEVRQVVQDDSVFMHPTDLPGVTRIDEGALAAVWQRRVRNGGSGSSLEYEFRVQFSRDDGESWSAPVIPHPGSSLGGEHEFHVAWPTPEGRLGLAWIDPRNQWVVAPEHSSSEAAYHGAMQLMATEIAPDGTLGEEVVVDEVICECCPNAVTVTPTGPVLASRDKRVPTEMQRDSLRYEMNVVRDVSVARMEGGSGGQAQRWESGIRATDDNWAFNGCPNNGPSLASLAGRVALAWWTAEGDDPRVQLRWSEDEGRSFGPTTQVSTAPAAG